MGSGGGAACGRAVFVFGRRKEEKISPQRTQSSQRREKKRKEKKRRENPHPERRRVRHPCFDPLPHLLPLVHLLQFLLVFLVDVEDGAVFVEGYVEGFGLFDEDVGELIFLD
jgi:hypothetical protein